MATNADVLLYLLRGILHPKKGRYGSDMSVDADVQKWEKAKKEYLAKQEVRRQYIQFYSWGYIGIEETHLAKASSLVAGMNIERGILSTNLEVSIDISTSICTI